MLLLLLACNDHKVTGVTTATDADGSTVVVTTIERTDPPAPNAAACEDAHRDEAACLAHGQALMYAGDWAGMEEVWYAQCNRGYAAACGELAYQYSNPYATLPNRASRAGEILQQACDRHAAPISCALLADAVEQGLYGFPVDAERGRQLRAEACAQGHVHSCEQP